MAMASPSKETMEQFGPGEGSTRGRPDGDASESSSVHSSEASERREVDILTQAFSVRSEEYRLLFRLPSHEVLIQDFNCALQDSILLQGHMYLFIHHVCFYSNIFGFETKKIISFHEVTCVRKAKTAAIFPNAIEIVTGGKKHFFGSFLSRDEAYRLIVDRWSQHCDAKALEDRQDLNSDISSQDNGLITFETVGSHTEPTDDLLTPERIDVNASEDFKSLSDSKSDVIVSKEVSGVDEIGEENAIPSSGDLAWQPEDLDAPKIPDYYTMVAEANFPVSIEEFFTLFFSDHAADFLENFQKSCGDTDLQCSRWRRHDQNGHTRDISFLHPIKVYLGAKSGHCQEVQKFNVYRNSHLMIESSKHIKDVPYGDYFRVEAIFDVEQHGNGESCNLRVYSNVAFSRKTMFKGKIEQSTKEECREVYGVWIRNAHGLLNQKNVLKLEGTNGRNVDIIEDNAGLVSSQIVRALEDLQPMTIETPEDNKKNSRTHIDNAVGKNVEYLTFSSASLNEPWACPSSFLKELWSTFCSYAGNQRHLTLILVISVIAVLILMQMSILVLLSRAPEVRIVTQVKHISSTDAYSLENIDWVEKRLNYLKQEMLMLGTQMERMHHEYAVLEAHLQSFERLKPNS